MESDDAIRAGAAWARRTESPLEIVHVGPHAMFRSTRNTHLDDALVARLEGLAETLETPARIVALQGDAPEEIVRRAKEQGAGLVVVGASTKGTAARFLLGSTAGQVVRRAPCPVLVVKAPLAHGPILVATDFSAPAAAATAAGAKEARARRVPLVLLHSVYEPEPMAALAPAVIGPPVLTEEQRSVRTAAAEELMQTLLQSADVPGDVQVSAGDPGRAITAAAEGAGAELVVVATHGRTGLARVTLGSVAQYVVNHSPCSVLVVRR